ncbi:MAG: MarR family transcriptional regulator, partial [Curtobacterium sp.]
VSRRTDPRDGRGILVALTPSGRQAVDAAIADLLAAERGILDEVSGPEQAQLSGLLRRLILGLGD